MGVMNQVVNDRYALYCGDCIEVMGRLPSGSVDLCIYSPPFAGLYQYSSDERDLSNSIDHDEFFAHYGYVVAETARLLKPGRLSFVHCMDIPLSNSGCDEMLPLPDEIRRIHKENGFAYAGMRVIWKEPLAVRNRTMMKSLHHVTVCEDATRTSVANADFLLVFRKKGENKVPVTHPNGLLEYAGEDAPSKSLLPWRGMEGDQKQNVYSHHIWRRYASSVWMDVRIDRVLPHLAAREDDDEQHVHPLQLDVIERAVVLGSNPGEVVLTPFMGVGSEVYGAVLNGRKAIGIELKPSYFRQAVQNCESIGTTVLADETPDLFAGLDHETEDETHEVTA